MLSTHRSRAAVVTALAGATLGLAGAASAAVTGLGQLNDDLGADINPLRSAGASDITGGALTAGGDRVPWFAFEQQTAGAQKIFVRSGKAAPFKTQGGALNIDPSQEAEAPSIDFAGTQRTVPWAAWYEPSTHLPGGRTNIFASRFAAAASTWVPEGQDRAPTDKVPSLNIHTDRDAENPALVGGATTAGAAPSPWVAWQERDGGADNAAAHDQIFVSRAIKQTDCSANAPGGGTSVSQFCWQQTGIKRLSAGAPTPSAAGDPSLNVDPTRDGIEPDTAFTGPGDTVPWVVWYEQGDSGLGLRGNEQVFAAKGVADAAADGGFHWVAVGSKTQSQTNTLDRSGAHGFGACAASTTAEDACSLNRDPSADAEDPRVAAGTLAPGGVTTPWVAWSEATTGGHHAIFVSRLVGGDHFELANGGLPVSDPAGDASKPDITFSGNVPHVSWLSQVGGEQRAVAGHFTSLTSFAVDTPGGLQPAALDGLRAPISSACTADPFTADGGACPAGDTTAFLTLTAAATPHRLLGFDVTRDAAGGQPVPTPGGTPPVTPPTTPGGKPPVTAPSAKVALSRQTVRLHADRTVRITVACPAGSRTCRGTLRLTAGKRTLGSARYAIAPGHHKAVRVRIGTSGRARIAYAGRRGLQVKATSGRAHVTLRIRR